MILGKVGCLLLIPTFAFLLGWEQISIDNDGDGFGNPGSDLYTSRESKKSIDGPEVDRGLQKIPSLATT